MTEGKRNQKEEGKQEKIFTVPFALEEIKENITINRNTPSKPSKEQIINQAIKFHLKGNISKATKYYQHCINQGFNDHRVFSNYGIILQGLGKLQDAELSTRKAIEIKPDFAMAHSNLGNILKDLGKLQDAESSIRKAIKLNPNSDMAHYNLGIILNDLGKLKEAELSYRKAIEIKPDCTDAYSNLGNIFRDLGKLQEAESSTRKAIKLNPNSDIAHYSLGGILKDLGKLQEAELSTRKAIEKNADLFEAHLQLGEILFELGKTREARISEWKAIEIKAFNNTLISYRENAKLIKKIAFWVFSYTIFNHFRPIIEINPNVFEILVPNNIDKDIIVKIHNDLKNKDIRIRSYKELQDKNLIYEKLVSNRGDDIYDFIENKNNIQKKVTVPTIKLFGKKNIRFMYTAGKNKYTISSYWNKYYDGILCYGPYHEEKFKARHNIPTSQMGYPRFDKYFKPGFDKDYLIKKFKCDPKKKTIVWLPTWTILSSIDKYHKVISSLRIDYNIVVRPHPSIRKDDPESYKKLFSVNFNHVDNNNNDNVQLYALADLMLFDYGGPMFGALYLNKNFAFLDMQSESKQNKYLGDLSSEEYMKSFLPDRIAKLDNLKSICNYCFKHPPSNSILKSLRKEFFNTNYQGNSGKRAYDLLMSDNWI